MNNQTPGLQLDDFISDFNVLWDVLEQAFEGVVVVNPTGHILYINHIYQDFLQVHDVTGKHVTEVIENTRMHIVAQTGKPELSAIQHIHGSDMIAHRIPIYRGGKLVGAVGTVLFQDVRELKALSRMVEHLREEVDYYKRELQRKSGALYDFQQIVGANSKMSELKAFAKRVAKSDTTVMLTGESGTGKELFAHAIHYESHRGKGPFIRVNCAAIPEQLLESELFGYEEGAFTGASRKGKKGKFELANNGTILLDEIGDMPLSLQAKLLRVLQEREIERVGGSKPIPIDVRFISSTHRNLLNRIKDGLFREDLYYRLNVVTLNIPPLRERLDDLPILVFSILEQLSDRLNIHVNDIDDAVWQTLRSYDWPGNVRELHNVLERALHLMEGDQLRVEHIAIPLTERTQTLSQPVTLREAIRNAEKAAVAKALYAAKGDKMEAARLLQIGKSSLYQKIELYGIQI